MYRANVGSIFSTMIAVAQLGLQASHVWSPKRSSGLASGLRRETLIHPFRACRARTVMSQRSHVVVALMDPPSRETAPLVGADVALEVAVAEVHRTPWCKVGFTWP